jgi:hypothetical protein
VLRRRLLRLQSKRRPLLLAAHASYNHRRAFISASATPNHAE